MKRIKKIEGDQLPIDELLKFTHVGSRLTVTETPYPEPISLTQRIKNDV